MKINCIVCGSNNTQVFIKAANTHGQSTYSTKKSFVYNKCDKCAAIFLTNEKFDAIFYKRYYDDKYRDQGKLQNSKLVKLLENFSNYKKRKSIEKYIKTNKIRLLDVGSGRGSFVASLPQNFVAYGIDIDKSYDKYFKPQKFIAGNFLHYKFKKNKFRVITAHHSVEHFSNPEKVFAKVNSLLSKNGFFYFSIPNYKCLGFEKGKENWFHMDAPRHIVHLCADTVYYLADKNKFDVIEIKNNYYDFPSDLFWSLKSYKYRYLYYILYPIFKFWDRETLTYVLRKNN